MRHWRIISCVWLGLLPFASLVMAGDQSLSEYCAESFHKDGVCPAALCQSPCLDGSSTQDCLLTCTPRECQSIAVADCPEQFCSIVVDCSQTHHCLPKIPKAYIPDCGGLAYSGQDVNCCQGMVKRCGFDYLDGSCNMEGKNSPYYLPLCIPCGDGICTNFENHCNCPEDCHKDIIPLN